MSRPRRLLTINPNTSVQITKVIEALVRSEAGPTVSVECLTARFGFRYLSSRVAVSIAGHAALDVAALALQSGEVPDAIIVGCFGDPGVPALREMTGLPVVGFAEAGIITAAAYPGKMLLATNGTVWCEMLSEVVDALGLQSAVADIVSIENVASEPAAIAAFVDAEAKRTGAARTVLGGAGLIPILPDVIARATTPILDPHRAAVRLAIEQAGTRPALPARAESNEVSGLSNELLHILTSNHESGLT